MIVKLTGMPGQPVVTLTGVTIIVATCTTLVALVVWKLGIRSPDPAAPKLIKVLLLVHWKDTPGCEVTNVTGAVKEPAQSIWLPGNGGLTIGIGFTVMVKLIGVPVQVTPPLVKLGVTVIVPLIGICELVVATKAILPLPLAGKPIAVLVLVQLYTVFATAPLKLAVVTTPAHTAWLACALTVGVGLTITVAKEAAPGQLLAVGVIVKVTSTGALVVLVKLPLMVPAPAGAIPVAAALLSLVQLNTVPATLPVNTIGVIAPPEQIVCVAGVLTVLGVGFTVIVKVVAGPWQLTMLPGV